MVRCQASIKQHIDINVIVSNGDDILIHHIDNKDSLRYGIYGLQWVIHAQYYLFPGVNNCLNGGKQKQLEGDTFLVSCLVAPCHLHY